MKNRPNIILLQGEDVGLHLGCYGDSNARTPNLDRLAAEGARFTNAFTHAPVCAPSRGGMVSGRYPYSLGNHHMRCTLTHPPRTFTQELRDAGYYVNWNTKLDFNFDPQEGWCDETSAWHEKPAPEQPFFLYENLSVTHESRMFPGTTDALDDPPTVAASLQPHDPARMTVPPHLVDCPEVRRQLAKYYNAFSVLDAEIGNRLHWLDAQGLRENTVVIFLSDHGRGLPREKRWCYDAGLHLPLIVRWPESIPPEMVCDELVGWVDIAPTLLSLAGVPVPAQYQGQVFLGDHTAVSRQYVFAGRDRMDEVFDRVRVARDKRWHYIRNYAPNLPWAQCQKYMEQQEVMGVMRELWRNGNLSGSAGTFFRETKPPEELYDVESDPDCIHNLADDPALTSVLERLRRALDQHLDVVGDLGAITEEELIERGILTNRLPEYRERRNLCPPERIIGPRPFPMTLREAGQAGGMSR